MRRLALGRLGYGFLLSLALLGLPPTGRAAEIERVKFETFDEVEIHGTFYGSAKGPKGPCAIMLHPVGGNTQLEGWDDLAKKLNTAGFSVLTFDFRGHGDSINVGQRFWLHPYNKTLKSYRPGKLREQINYKDFTNANHFGMLVNDIVAAKRYLDKRNDSGDCNSANTVVIGAESGATLGALWIRTEWSRRRLQTGFPVVTPTRPHLEGEDIAGAVWLSISPNIGAGNTRVTVHPDTWLTTPSPPVRDKVPMYFLYGDKDTKAANFSEYLCDKVLRPETKNPKLKLTGKRPIKDTSLSGRELLGKPSLGTEDLILKYVNKVTEEARNPHAKKDVSKLPLYPVDSSLLQQLLR
jgi:pimeloyl-ACP methyl ester carboxylesterase